MPKKTTEYCDLPECWNEARFASDGEPYFYDFDPEGLIEYLFCSREHKEEWVKYHKYELPVEFEGDEIHEFSNRLPREDE